MSMIFIAHVVLYFIIIIITIIYLILWFFFFIIIIFSILVLHPTTIIHYRQPSTGKRVLLNHPHRIYFIYNNIIYITYCSTYTHIAYTAPSEYHPSCRRRYLGQYYGNVDPFIIQITSHRESNGTGNPYARRSDLNASSACVPMRNFSTLYYLLYIYTFSVY